MACANKGLGLFDKHFMKTALCQNVEYDMMWCFCEDGRCVWFGCFCIHYVLLCACMCLYWIRLFLRRWGDEVALGGVRGQSALIPLPVRVSPPWLLTADGSHVSTLWMSARWKAQTGKHITEWLSGDEHQTSFPLLPHCGITLRVQYEALSATAGAYIKSNDSCVALSWMTGNRVPEWFSAVQ